MSSRLGALTMLAGIGLLGLLLGVGGATWLQHMIGGAPTAGRPLSPAPPVVGFAQGGAFDIRSHLGQVPGIVAGGQASAPPAGAPGQPARIVITVGGADHVFHATTATFSWESTPSTPDSWAIISWAGLDGGVCGSLDATQNGLTSHESQCSGSGFFGFTGHWAGGAPVRYTLRAAAR